MTIEILFPPSSLLWTGNVFCQKPAMKYLLLVNKKQNNNKASIKFIEFKIKPPIKKLSERINRFRLFLKKLIEPRIVSLEK